MSLEDPFAILGVPRDRLRAAYSAGDEALLRTLAEGFYKVLSRIYHPDRGGDPEYFAKIVQARDEILDAPLVVADFFLGDLALREEARVQLSKSTRAPKDSGQSGTINPSLLRAIDSTLVWPDLVGSELVVRATSLGHGLDAPPVALLRLSWRESAGESGTAEAGANKQSLLWCETHIFDQDATDNRLSTIQFHRNSSTWKWLATQTEFERSLAGKRPAERMEAERAADDELGTIRTELEELENRTNQALERLSGSGALEEAKRQSVERELTRLQRKIAALQKKEDFYQVEIEPNRPYPIAFSDSTTVIAVGYVKPAVIASHRRRHVPPTRPAHALGGSVEGASEKPNLWQLAEHLPWISSVLSAPEVPVEERDKCHLVLARFGSKAPRFILIDPPNTAIWAPKPKPKATRAPR